MPLFKIFRYDPNRPDRAEFQEFTVPSVESMTVLEGLYHILENDDPTLAFRSSCRQGACGSCAMHINGQYRLACEAQVSGLGEEIIIRPLAHLEIIRDLVVDMEPFYRQYEAIKPYLMPEVEPPEHEYHQNIPQRAKLDTYIDCILCAACYGSCPVVATDEKYLGPHALLKVLRFVNDNRDDATNERLAYVSDDFGIFRCHTIFNCQQVCPKDLDPSGAIANLKMKSIRQKLVVKFK